MKGKINSRLQLQIVDEGHPLTKTQWQCACAMCLLFQQVNLISFRRIRACTDPVWLTCFLLKGSHTTSSYLQNKQNFLKIDP